MKFDPQKHHRRSIRLKGYDYSQPGAYFVTLCTWRRVCLFGEVRDGQVWLSDLGRIVHEEWLRSIDIRREIRLYEDEFVVMPNHFHAIVWIVGADGDVGEVGVGADGVRPPDKEGACHAPLRGSVAGTVPGSTPSPIPAASPGFLHRTPRSLSSFMAGFKAVVTRRARVELNIRGVWQRNFYERILRDEQAFMAVWAYIDHNPRKWLEDRIHPDAPPNPFNQAKPHG